MPHGCELAVPSLESSSGDEEQGHSVVLGHGWKPTNPEPGEYQAEKGTPFRLVSWCRVGFHRERCWFGIQDGHSEQRWIDARGLTQRTGVLARRLTA